MTSMVTRSVSEGTTYGMSLAYASGYHLFRGKLFVINDLQMLSRNKPGAVQRGKI